MTPEDELLFKLYNLSGYTHEADNITYQKTTVMPEKEA